ncbi:MULTISPECIES: HlyC/CorC family transporter [Marichromatium]|uniref:Mg2+/Co2+ transporter CorB n=1 Tax=Marichromatium gracile TaxID=1048 RepID=A0A4V2W933_MARGR|nr:MULTISPECIES: HlyC/CorC family transporter [Marichromatium]MBK1709783.1 magnesium/cobalt efflux protein [Marichromatium gracile]RNE91247.1 HlyC/CorC family transporter [Marichromatium sp. AB31]RNE92967.1 HlyC/CorC family transporter [Marichromatium sp. AB32]TCW33307.1 Mg2+/Co2+ transporter CorB [Marichromatium gracile]
MNDFPLPGLFLILFLLILLSAFFSGSETALLTLNRYRLRHQADQGNRGARRARKLLDRPDRLIGLILLGNNFVNIMASSLATVIAIRLGGEAAIGIAAGLLTLVILIFAEVTPKTYATLHPERLAFPAAYVYGPLLKLLYPVVWLVNLFTNGLLRLMGIAPEDGGQGTALSREELRTVVSEAGAMIPERSRSMLLGILDLERATVEDIMIPRNEVDGIDIQDSAEEIIQAVRNTNYTRLPLYDGGIDNVIGVFHARNALHALLEKGLGKEHLRAIARQPYFVPEGTPLYQQLLNFQHTKQRVGLVVDEYGDFQGLITLADLLEEIVGEFTTDPSDSISEIQPAEDGSLLIDCGIGLRELNRVLRWELPTDGPKTLNGLILEYLETIPEPGTSLKLSGHPMEIIQTADNGVKTVRIIPRPTRRPRR